MWCLTQGTCFTSVCLSVLCDSLNESLRQLMAIVSLLFHAYLSYFFSIYLVFTLLISSFHCRVYLLRGQLQAAVFPKIYDGSSSFFWRFSPLYTGRVSKATALHKLYFGRLSPKHFNFYWPRKFGVFILTSAIWTDRQTDKPSTVTLACAPRVNLEFSTSARKRNKRFC